MARARATNPFLFGSLALDDAFADRQRELAELTADARNGQDVVVFAPRRYGKSSLVWRAAQRLARSGVLVAQVDLMTTPTKERLAGKLAAAIHDELATRMFRARERLEVFGSLRITPTVTVDPGSGAVSFSFSASAPEADVDATLEQLLALPGRLSAERGKRVVLVLDEFQEIVDLDPGLPKLLRAVFQEQPEVAHFYLGSKRHMMERIFDDENEPFWRSARRVELGTIPVEEFGRHIAERFAATGRSVAADALDRCLELTGGHPYATQELCYSLWEEARDGRAANLAAVDRALLRVLQSEHAHFSLVWERATGAQRLVLRALASEGPGRPLGEPYRARHSLPPAATVQAALGGVIKNELVKKTARGEYALAEPFLGEWIRWNER